MRLVFENGVLLTEGPDNDYVWNEGELVIRRARMQLGVRVIRVIEVDGSNLEDFTIKIVVVF